MALVLPTAVFSQHTIPGTGEGLLYLGKIPSYRILFARQNSFVPDIVCPPEFLRTGSCLPARIPSYRILFACQNSFVPDIVFPPEFLRTGYCLPARNRNTDSLAVQPEKAKFFPAALTR
jgi:UDP-glucose 6-dehydrogenase